MQYNSIDELLTQLRVILQANGSARIYRTVFVLLPDGDSWCDVLALLRREGVKQLRLSPRP